MHPIDEEFLEKLREERQKEVEMWYVPRAFLFKDFLLTFKAFVSRAIVRELIGYFIFIMIIYIISYGNRDPMSFRYKRHIEYNFIKKNGFDEVGSNAVIAKSSNLTPISFFFIYLLYLDCDVQRLVAVGPLHSGPPAQGTGLLQRPPPVRSQGLHWGPRQQDLGLRHPEAGQGRAQLVQVRRAFLCMHACTISCVLRLFLFSLLESYKTLLSFPTRHISTRAAAEKGPYIKERKKRRGEAKSFYLTRDPTKLFCDTVSGCRWRGNKWCQVWLWINFVWWGV